MLRKWLRYLIGEPEPKICQLCEERKLMLEQERAEKFRLLAVLLPNKTEPEIAPNVPFTAIPSSRHRGWNAQRAELESNSRREAEILLERKRFNNEPKSISNEETQERIKEIENELNVVGE